MKDIKRYINTRTAIHCETEKESFEICKLIESIGGKNLHGSYNVYNENTCYDFDNIEKMENMYDRIFYYKKINYKILKAKDILNKEETMKYTFKNGTTLDGSFSTEQLKQIAKVFGESLYPIYHSKSLGDIPVDEMHNNHLTNSILLHLREYYVQKNFRGLDLVDFRDYLTQYDNVTRMLIEELDRRIKNEKI